jgi:hypothetical protein
MARSGFDLDDAHQAAAPLRLDIVVGRVVRDVTNAAITCQASTPSLPMLT